MSNSEDAGVVADRTPRLGQAPSICRLCNVHLNGGETFRAHAKSDLHVYNLRLKVAEPDGATSPPTPPRSGSPQSRHESSSSSSGRRHPPAAATVKDESDDAYDSEIQDEDEDPEIPEFDPAQCIFCSEESGDLDGSLQHMAASHGFTVPFQEFLAVDLETVVWYLHFVINGYRECISCGTKRSTPEAAQQHMMAKGHCRFDITGDMEDFYEMPKEENMVLERTKQDISGTVRLPSGKIISNRNYQEPAEPRQRQPRSNPFLEALTEGPPPESRTSNGKSKSAPAPPPSSSSEANPSTEVASRAGQEHRGGQMVRSSEALLAAQLSRLVLAGDRAQIRLEARKRGKMERKNNKILQKHFKLDAGDSRAGRNFCC